MKIIWKLLKTCWKSVQWKKRNNFIKFLKYGEYVPLIKINIISLLYAITFIQIAVTSLEHNTKHSLSYITEATPCTTMHLP